MIRQEFRRILDALRSGNTAVREMELDGEAYLRTFAPDERLILLGSGHIAQPLCRHAAELGFAVTVCDDRPEFANSTRFPDAACILCDGFAHAIPSLRITEKDYVCILTRGHRFDAECLRAILPGPMPKFIGMVGSRRRVHDLKQVMLEEGYPQQNLERICAPIGLDINAMTAGEIAVSILAQLIQYRRQGVDRHQKGPLLTEQGIDIAFIERLLDPVPKVLMTICRSSGSTPVKSGSMMLIDKNRATAGTIGGGCAEGSALQEAYRMIGSGQKRCIHIDMTNDMAAEEGMVCGGHMDVLLEDVDG